MASLGLSWTARSVRGEGKAKAMGIPTINLNPDDTPRDLQYGIYACRITWSSETHDAVSHYGPRPFHNLPVSFEIHLLVSKSQNSKFKNSNKFKIQNVKVGSRIGIEVVQKIRNIENFETEEALREQIARDICEASTILKSL